MLSHSFSSGSLKDVCKTRKKNKVVSKISHVLCTFAVVRRWALIYLGVKSLFKPDRYLVVFFVVCSKRRESRFVLLTLQRYGDISG